ncbi:MAG: type II toxin-antitoxin system HicA family toxin [Caldisericum sp.]|uniref:type II toxin-antitoxin system HicA family toxin n=1 Tax=Caldisericum sp. TaxID=2499687 RepID=UPI003D0E3C9A
MKIEKLIEKLLSVPTPCEMDYRDIKRILEHEGWSGERRAKHYVYVKVGEYAITIPVHSPKEKVKGYVLKQIIEMLNLEEKYGRK